MFISEKEKFLILAEEEKAGVKVLKTSEAVFEAKDVSTEKEKAKELFFVFEGEKYLFSERAQKNLQKLTGISRRLFNELPVDQLLKDLTHQLGKLSTLGVILGSGMEGETTYRSVLAFYDNDKNTFVGYKDLLSQVEDKILFVKGNPLVDDFVQVQFVGFDNEEFTSGVNLLLSSTGNASTTISVGLLEKKSSLFWRDIFYKRYEEKGISAEGIKDLLVELKGDPEFAVTLNRSLLIKADTVKIKDEQHLEGILEAVPGKKFRGVIQKTYTDPIANQKLLERVGIEKLDNLKDIFRILIFFSTNAPNNRLNLSTGIKFYDWFFKTASAIL